MTLKKVSSRGKLLRSLAYFMVFFCCGCQTNTVAPNRALAVKLDSIYKLDQSYRRKMMALAKVKGFSSPEVQALARKQRTVDSTNLKFVGNIIDSLSHYPGRSLVGDSLKDAAFYVLQHAPDSLQAKYYPLILEADQRNEISKSAFAKYQDRYLVHKNQPQVFGTQLMTLFLKDPLSGERRDSTFLKPIRDTNNIDSLRAVYGLQPLEEYLNRFDLSRWN